MREASVFFAFFALAASSQSDIPRQDVEVASTEDATSVSTTTASPEPRSMSPWAYLCIKPFAQFNHEMSLVTKHLEGIRSVLVQFDTVIQEEVHSTFEEVQSLHTALREVETDVVSTSETLDRLVDWTSAMDKRMAALETTVQRGLETSNAQCHPSKKKKKKKPKKRRLRMTDTSGNEHGEVLDDFSGHTGSCCVEQLRSELSTFKKHVFDEVTRRVSSCAEIQRSRRGEKSGAFNVNPHLSGYDRFVTVFCDMDTDGGGWTVIQRRSEYATVARTDFNRSWAEYRKGFGSVLNEFWLGNDAIYALTNQEAVTLRIDLESFEDEKRYAQYSSFRIEDQDGKYQLSLGDYKGSASDSLGRSRGMNFSTYDSDNDVWSGHCAQRFQGGWWYNSCHDANLNGRYHGGHHESYGDGINWYHWKGFHYSLKSAEMKIRPASYIKSTNSL